MIYGHDISVYTGAIYEPIRVPYKGVYGYRIRAFIFLCVFALFGCASNTAKQQETAPPPIVSPAEILASVQCGADEFRGFGTGANETEALNEAYSFLARQVQSSINVSEKYTRSQKVSDGNESLSSDYASRTMVESHLSNAHDARVLRVERGTHEAGAVVCMSRADAARGFIEQQRPIADSLELAINSSLAAKHPKLKSEAWQRTQALWNGFIKLQSIIDGLGAANVVYFEAISGKYAQAREDYISFCQTAKLHWNPEQENLYSDIAFSKLSRDIKLEKSVCNGYGISLIYKKPEHKCELAGIYNCSHQPALLIASCEGAEYRLLENPSIGSFHKKEDVSLENLHEKLRNESFWAQWEQEIKQWIPQCE